MLPDRLTNAVRDHGKSMLNAGNEGFARAVRGRKKPLLYAGAALALAGAGTASVATLATGASATPLASATINDPSVHHGAAAHTAEPATRPHAATTAGATAKHATAARRPTAKHATPARRPAAAHATAAPRVTATHASPRPRPSATHAHPASLATPPRNPTRYTVRPAQTRPAARHAVTAPTAAQHAGPVRWYQVLDKLNAQTDPAAAAHHQLPYSDKLTPVSFGGPQSWMPVSPAQVANATTIVKQALAKRMGLRSAVIAVATAMQESKLLNLSYGTGDSLGLFQQQWDMGWGTPSQIMNPAYSADAFLNALRQYQAGDPGWAAQPLWQSAQGVQKSAFPSAYAQWEGQAAQLVAGIATNLVQAHM